jgi:mRNA interferase MazF
MQIRRGDVFFADLSLGLGSEQGGTRPVLILQNDIGNQYSPTTIVAVITSQLSKVKLPTHVEVTSNNSGLEKDSLILLEQIRTIDKTRLKEKVASLSDELIEKVAQSLEISLGLIEI